jgi:hypothetical protein
MAANKSKHDFTQPTPREATLKALKTGIEAAFPKAGTIMIDGVEFTRHAFEAKVDEHLQPEAAARKGHLDLERLVAAKDENAGPADDFIVAAHDGLVSKFGRTNKQTLALFGVAPRKERRKATSAENVLRAAKSKETRQKRDTLGPAQKAAIKGDTPPAISVSKSGRIQIAPDASAKTD